MFNVKGVLKRMKLKTWNRLLAGILCLFMVFPNVPAPDICVVAKASETSTVPEVKEEIWYEQFEDTTVNKNNWGINFESEVTGKKTNYYNYTNGKGIVDSSNKVYRMTRTNDTQGALYQNIYFNTNGTYYTGIYGLEVTVKKSATGIAKLRIDGKDGKVGEEALLAETVWNSDEELSLIYYKDAERTEQGEAVIGTFTSETIKLNYWFDTASSKVSLWVDDVRYVTSQYTQNDASGGLEFMRSTLEGTTGDTLELDNIRFYKSYPMTAAERLVLDMNWLTEDLLVNKDDTYLANDQISCNLNLPTTGDCLSTITWASSNPDVISENGTVTRTNEDTVVTMTATIKAKGLDGSEAQNTVDFTFTVAADTVTNPSILPEEKELIWSETFEDENLNGNWSVSNYKNGNTGTVNVEKQAFLITRNASVDDGASQDVYFATNKSTCAGIYGFEFTIKRSNLSVNELILLRLVGEKTLSEVTWEGDGTVFASGCFPDGVGVETEQMPSVEKGENDTLKVNYLIDTTSSKTSIWIDGEKLVDSMYTKTSASEGIKYIRIAMRTGAAGDNLEIDNIRFYKAYPMTAEERLALDEAELTQDKLIDANDPYLEVGQISYNLTLPTSGDNKTAIVWSSSNPEVISNGGQVVCTDEVTEVTMTATLTATGADGTPEQTTKNFTFSVAALKELSDAEAVAKVSEYLTLDVISPLDNASNGIIRSLSLPKYHDLYGCDISWSSSNEAYITESGRVIRPRYDEEDVEVTLTCVISRGECQETKEYTFKVLADQEFVDPEHMTDEEFFGVWDETANNWTTVGKFDYENEGLKELEAAVKAVGTGGDYTSAKNALFNYFKNGRNQEAVVGESNVNTLLANATITGFQFIQFGKHCIGEMSFGTEWDYYTADLGLRDITANSTISYSLQAWYNEDTSVEIARSDWEDESKRPHLELTVNGEKKTFVAMEDALIRSGSYAEQNFSDAETLDVWTYGDFLDDGHTRALIKFNTGLTGDDVVTEARLILYGRMVGSSEEKKVFIGYEPDSTWSKESVTWNTLDGLYYSFNGLGDSNEEDSGVSKAGKWEIVDGSITNYPKQITRFDTLYAVTAEYMMTGDEQYAYYAIRHMESLIRDRGGWTSKTTSMDRTDPDPDPAALRGGYATTLTASLRVTKWLDNLPVLMESKYATADFITSVLKTLWDTGNFLTVYYAPSGNTHQTEKTALLDLGTRLPEFYDAQNGKNWHEIGRSGLEKLILDSTFEDGSYQESTESYGQSVVGTYVEFKEKLLALGTDTSEVFNKRLHNFALYQALLYANDGSNAQYGDSGDGTRKADKYELIYKWFNDEELEYIITYGVNGTEPSWTSKCFFDSGVTTLRSDWSTDGTWILTNVRGGGNHGHKDYNSITLHAFGRRLLIDSGYFEYDSTNDYTAYGKSTEGHNTVMINDTSQETFFDKNDPLRLYGTIHNFLTNEEYDYLEQSTPNTPGYEHRRSITFIKSGLVIVSDLMKPENLNEENNYKQLWHLAKESNYTISTEDLTIRSAYADGGNIALAIAKDEGVNVVKSERGWRARTYGNVEDAPYAYFEINGAGIQTMDTVLMLTEDEPTATVTAEKLESRENTTAMKFDMVTKDGSFTGYYLQSYDGEGGNFGPFTTDAHTAYVLLDEEGNVKEMLFNEGTYIRYMEGNISLVEATEEQESLFVDLAGSVDYLSGSIVYMTGDEETIDSVKVLAQDDCLGIVVNGVPYTYDTVDSYITNIGAGASSTEENLPPLEIILEGTETSYQNGSDEDVSIHCTGDLEKLTGVQMDGVDVDENNYTLTEGSTIVTFKTEYLETLSVGEHTVTLLYTDSQVESKLEILAAAGDNSDDDSTSTEGDDSDDDTTSSEESADEDDTTSTEQQTVEDESATQPASAQATAAPTGDSQNILLWLVVLGMFAMLVCSKKIRK